MSTRAARPALPAIGTEDDSVLGREYVVVEKRTVEINALADELNSKRSPLPGAGARRNSRGFLTRPPSSTSTALITTAATPYPPPADLSSTPPFAIGKTRPSPPLRPPMLPYSSSRSPLAAPQAAIARAISLASLKLFGSPSQGILLRRTSARKPISRSSEVLDPQEVRRSLFEA
jgi:serine/threonine-protein kinase ULK/ATG1